MVRKAVRLLVRVVLALAVIVAVLAAAVSAAAWVGWRGAPDPSHTSAGRNAVWLGDEWRSAGRIDQLDPAQLLERLGDNDISDAFLPVGISNARGKVPESNHRELDAALDELGGRGVRIHAVVGGAGRAADGFLRLDDDETLDGLVATAEQVLGAGYDGIVLELHPWASGDERLLDLLDRLHAVTQDAGAELTVAAPPPEPLTGFGALDEVGGPATWSKEYHLEVAQRVDTVVVVVRVSLPFDWMYGAFAARSARTLVDLHRGSDVEVLIGLLPTGQLRAGIRGVQKGVEDADPPQLERLGLALLGEPAPDSAVWRDWRERWIEGDSGGEGAS